MEAKSKLTVSHYTNKNMKKTLNNLTKTGFKTKNSADTVAQSKAADDNDNKSAK